MFSKHGATVKKDNKSSISGLFWMLLGSLLTVVIGVFLYLSPLFNFRPVVERKPPVTEYQVQPKVNTDTDNAEYEFYDVLPSQEMMTIPNSAIGADPEAKPQKKFRADAVVVIEKEKAKQPSDTSATDSDTSVAANADVDLEEVATAGENTDAADNSVGFVQEKPQLPSKTYVLQINSFGNVDEADKRRAQVMMAGVDAQVIKMVTANEQNIYQVISKPMISQQAIMEAQQLLQNNGIDSLIVEQHRK